MTRDWTGGVEVTLERVEQAKFKNAYDTSLADLGEESALYDDHFHPARGSGSI